MRGASMMTPVANAMERDIHRLFPGVPTQTVHNGADPIPASIVQNPRPPELAGKKVVFSAGGFFKRKGIPQLVGAFGKVAPRHPEALLRIAGDGGDRPEIEAAIARSGVAGRITLLGAQPHERVLQEMVWSDLFALIGWSEPFATVYLEALAAGRPIVCCNDGGINDVIQNEVHALTVPPKDIDAAAAALDRLLTDENVRLRMGSAARELFDTRMSWDARARAMIDVFERVLHRTPVKRGDEHAPDSPDSGVNAAAALS
jgi:glycosyltransferase involved in cell wall biosynthesis